MNLYLIRHAIAEEPGDAPDELRPLTEKGRKKMRKIARALSTLEIRPNLVLTSPLVRARETAEILADALRLIDDKIVETEFLMPGGDPQQLIEKINSEFPGLETIALVGHEPALSSLASVLLTGMPDVELVFKKGGVCALAVSDLHFGRCAALEWFLAPAQLVLMS